jgi:tetratricopeptide (TPR) repeat protein
MIHHLFRHPLRQAAIGMLLIAAAHATSLEQAVKQFEQAERAWNLNGFQAAERTAADAHAKHPASADAAYWLAVTKFHIALYQREHAPKAESGSALDEAQKAAKHALEINPSSGELHAMLGTILGIKSSGNLLVGMTHGKTIDHHRREALRLSPINPRVTYLLGVAQHRTARTSERREESIKTLMSARQLFQREQHQRRDALSPRWGHSQCLQFLGEAYHLLGKNEEATDAYKACLTLQPGNNHAKQALAKLKGS